MTSTTDIREDSLAIHTQDLGKRFGSRIALESIDLEVPRGTAFGFLGPNGAGKTTLIRMLLGLAEPTSGSMRLLGRDLPEHRAAALARVGAIIEEPRFHAHLTGRENLAVHAAARDRSAAGRIPASLERVGLAARADEKVKAYSLGMRQRLGIARCLLADPELLILDEPMNGLDPAGILELRGLIRDLVGEGRTVMLSSHLLDEVEKTCDAAAIVDDGRIVAQGSISDLRNGGTGDSGDRHRLRQPHPGGGTARRDSGSRQRDRLPGPPPGHADPRRPGRSRDRHRAAAPSARRGDRRRPRRPRDPLARRALPDHDDTHWRTGADVRSQTDPRRRTEARPPLRHARDLAVPDRRHGRHRLRRDRHPAPRATPRSTGPPAASTTTRTRSPSSA